MRSFFFLATALMIGPIAAKAEPVDQLKTQLNTRREELLDWFKVELTKIAQHARTDDERKSVLTACDWVWDAGKAGITSITLKANGSGIHHYQGSTFAWTCQGWTVKLFNSQGATAELKFDPVTLRFTGKDFDGKNAVKGSPKLQF